jgi:hypothetical protein
MFSHGEKVRLHRQPFLFLRDASYTQRTQVCDKRSACHSERNEELCAGVRNDTDFILPRIPESFWYIINAADLICNITR